MSTWGPGNFDSDTARDHLFDLMQGLADNIEDALSAAAELALSSGVREELTEQLEIVMPNIEIICLLHESLGGGFLPEPDVVADWRERFEQIRQAVPESELSESAERRAVIESTFARLRQLALQCWGE